MYYSACGNHCRMDLFRPSGEWYATFAHDFPRERWAGTPNARPFGPHVSDGGLPHPEHIGPLHDLFCAMVVECLCHNLYSCRPREVDEENIPDSYNDWFVVCLEPYHEHAHPQMIRVGDAKKRVLELQEGTCTTVQP